MSHLSASTVPSCKLGVVMETSSIPRDASARSHFRAEQSFPVNHYFLANLLVAGSSLLSLFDCLLGTFKQTIKSPWTYSTSPLGSVYWSFWSYNSACSTPVILWGQGTIRTCGDIYMLQDNPCVCSDRFQANYCSIGGNIHILHLEKVDNMKWQFENSIKTSKFRNIPTILAGMQELPTMNLNFSTCMV